MRSDSIVSFDEPPITMSPPEYRNESDANTDMNNSTM